MTVLQIFSYILIMILVLSLVSLELNARDELYSIRDISSHRNGSDESPVFSPDGRYLAYVRLINKISETWILDLKTQREKKVNILSKDTQLYRSNEDEENKSIELSWSPCSKFFVFSGRGDIYLGSVNMDCVFRLTNNSEVDAEPSWSPDGRYIAFISSRSNAGDIYLIDIEKILNDMLNNIDTIENYDISEMIERYPICLTHYSKENNSFNWSPDGKSIVYNSRSQNPSHPKGSETFNIMVICDIDKITPDTPAKPIFLTDWFGFDEENPSWSPKYEDGFEYIAFYSNWIKMDVDALTKRRNTENKEGGLNNKFMLYSIKVDYDRLKKLSEKDPFIHIKDAESSIVLRDTLINPDKKNGPGWFQDFAGIIYSKEDSNNKNPIYYVNTGDKEKQESKQIAYGTLWNESVTVNNSKIAFIANEPESYGYGKCLYFSVFKRENK